MHWRFSVVESVLAAVRVGPSKTEIREFPMPDIAVSYPGRRRRPVTRYLFRMKAPLIRIAGE